MQDLKITIVQAHLVWEDVQGNLDHFSKLLDQKPDTDIIVLPETFTTGFTLKSPGAFAETMEGNTVEWLKEQAEKHQCSVTGSVIIEEAGKFYNRLLWVGKDGSVQYYNKRHLFSYSGEQEHFTPGSEHLIVEVKGWRIMPLVCYDLRFPVWSRNQLSNKNDVLYDLLLYTANWPERRIDAWKTLLKARAIENQAYVVGVSRIGEDGNGINYSGDSLVFDPIGETLFHGEDREWVKTVSLNGGRLQEVRKRFPFLADADQFNITK